MSKTKRSTDPTPPQAPKPLMDTDVAELGDIAEALNALGGVLTHWKEAPEHVRQGLGRAVTLFGDMVGECSGTMEKYDLAAIAAIPARKAG